MSDRKNAALSAVKELKEIKKLTNFIKDGIIDFYCNENYDSIILLKENNETIEYNVSEISYIFIDVIEGFGYKGLNYQESIGYAEDKLKNEFENYDKDTFIKLIGSLCYGQVKTEEFICNFEKIQRDL